MWDKCDQSVKPEWDVISEYVDNPAWNRLREWMESDYQVIPALEYSRCSMLKGWNVKYRKGGKALCTVYPMAGYFSALVTIGPKEMEAAEEMMAACTDRVRQKFQETELHRGLKWMMLDVDDDLVLNDVMALVALRRPKKAAGGRSKK